MSNVAASDAVAPIAADILPRPPVVVLVVDTPRLVDALALTTTRARIDDVACEDIPSTASVVVSRRDRRTLRRRRRRHGVGFQ
jgi:hypothetical protein